MRAFEDAFQTANESNTYQDSWSIFLLEGKDASNMAIPFAFCLAN